MIFDTHCHLQFKGFKDEYGDVLKRCQEKDVALNIVGTQKDTSRAAVEMAEKSSNVYATIGLHPVHLFPTHIDEEESSFLSREEDFDEKFYRDLAQSSKVVGIGECGLDFYHLPEGIDKKVVFAKQKSVFLKQLKLAEELKKTLVIHVRDAHKEMIELLEENTQPNSLQAVVHCYTGNWSDAKEYLDLGFYIGFTGVITFPAKKLNPQPTLDILEVVEKTPLEKIVIETDAPYLAPQAYRGQKCEPWMFLTTNNAQKLFHLG
ncbi:MAG: TatD family hydrolase [Candidatus Magasanikbacteria bacterium]|nr:TatD family hydrolase [Candidatus Magasanikbacteria bacterium]